MDFGIRQACGHPHSAEILRELFLEIVRFGSLDLIQLQSSGARRGTDMDRPGTDGFFSEKVLAILPAARVHDMATRVSWASSLGRGGRGGAGLLARPDSGQGGASWQFGSPAVFSRIHGEGEPGSAPCPGGGGQPDGHGRGDSRTDGGRWRFQSDATESLQLRSKSTVLLR